MQEDSVQINIGKKGITDEVTDEISKMLKKRKTVNVKLLRSSIEGKDKEEIGNMLEMIRKTVEEKLSRKVDMGKKKGFRASYTMADNH